jgi:predicted CoA-substrate-specific enzyme activase
VIDGGALFVRSSTLSPEGHVVDRAVTEKCAAGSGRFLEMVAGSLRVPLEEVSDVASTAATPYRMSNSCAVFAESEVISRVNQGVPGPELLAGILVAIAEKALTLASRSEATPPVVVVGGLGHIPAFMKALGEVLGHQVSVIPMDPQLAAAYGAALIAGQPAAAPARSRTQARRGP